MCSYLYASDVEYDTFVSFHSYLFLGPRIFLEIYALYSLLVIVKLNQLIELL